MIVSMTVYKSDGIYMTPPDSNSLLFSKGSCSALPKYRRHRRRPSQLSDVIFNTVATQPRTRNFLRS